MKRLNVSLSVAIIVLISLLLIFPGCKNEKELVVKKKASMEKKSDEKTAQQPLDEDERQFQEKLDKLVQDIKLREAELEAKAKILEEKLTEVHAKQLKLEKIEARMQKLQTLTIVILIIGILAILVGLVMLFKKRNAPKEAKAPAPKTETKEQPKAEEKPEKKTTTRKPPSGSKKTS